MYILMIIKVTDLKYMTSYKLTNNYDRLKISSCAFQFLNKVKRI